MWSAYARVKLIVLMLLVDASLGDRYPVTRIPYPSLFPRWNCLKVLERQHANSLSYFVDGSYCRCALLRNQERDENVTVGIKWGILNETRFGYSTNVTIFNNNSMNQDIEGPWELSWELSGLIINESLTRSTMETISNGSLYDCPNMHSMIISGLLPPHDGDYCCMSISDYICETAMDVITTPQYLNTWTTVCSPDRRRQPQKFNEIHNKDEL